MAAVPSCSRSSVSGIPNGRKKSAVGPCLAFGIQTPTWVGCVSLGARLFAECCALEQVGMLTENTCRLADGAIISPYAFEGCERLAQIGLPSTKAITDVRSPSSSPVGLPIGCFHSSGIQAIKMLQETTFIGHKAFALCQQLTVVDLSQTQVDTVHMQVFAHCQSLAQISLPMHPTQISAEAFEACRSLCTVALPQTLRYIGHRAFAEYNKLVRLTFRSTKARRRLRIAANAFEGCQALTIPGGVCYLSLRGKRGTQGSISRGGSR